MHALIANKFTCQEPVGNFKVMFFTSSDIVIVQCYPLSLQQWGNAAVLLPMKMTLK